MERAPAGPERGCGRTPRPKTHAHVATNNLRRLLPVLLFPVPHVWAQIDFGLGNERDQNGASLKWWVVALEWGAGTAVGTGTGILANDVGSIHIPYTRTALDVPIGTLNGIVRIAVSTPFGCAAGCDAVGLATGNEGVLWYGFAVGGIGAAASDALGALAYTRTGSTVLRRLIPAAIGSAGAVVGYNLGIWWLSLVSGATVTTTEVTTSNMWERRPHRWQSVAIEAPCGAALSAVGGLVLPRWLHEQPDSLGNLSPEARTGNRVMDICVIYPATCLVGIDAVGMILRRQNEFWIGYLGATLGTAAVVGIGVLAGFGEQLDSKPLARLLPAAAAGIVGAIGYNAMDIEEGGWTGQQRFRGPVLADAGPDYCRGGTGFDFNLRLLTVRF